jgi:uncharacterized protein DUF998
VNPTINQTSKMYYQLALAAVIGPILFTLMWLILGFISPGYTIYGTEIAPYSIVSQAISGLGLGVTGPYMNANFIITGLLLVLGGIGISNTLFRSFSPIKRMITSILLALPGIGCAMDGIFTIETFLFHFIGFGLVLTTILSYPIIGFFMRKDLTLRTLGMWLIVAGPVTLVLAVWYFMTFSPTVEGSKTGIAGITERILVTELLFWYVVMGWKAYVQKNDSIK